MRLHRIAQAGRKPYYVTRQPGGRQVYLGTVRREAVRRFRDLAAGIQPVRSGPAPLTVNGLVAAFLQERPDLDETGWLKAWHRFEDRGRTELQDLGPECLNDFLRHLQHARYDVAGPRGRVIGKRPYAAKTIRHYVNAAHAALQFARARGWITECPAKPKTPRPRREPRDISRAQASALLQALPSPHRDVVAFILATGCRPGEACRLQWDWLRDGEFRIPPDEHKTGRRTGRGRSIFLTPDAAAVIERRPRRGPHVFTGRYGQPFNPRQLRVVTRGHGMSRPYSLRHTFAQAALDAGTPLEVLSELLGHSNVTTTQIYAQVRARRARAAATSLVGLLPVQSAGPAATSSVAERPASARAKPRPNPRKRGASTAVRRRA